MSVNRNVREQSFHIETDQYVISFYINWFLYDVLRIIKHYRRMCKKNTFKMKPVNIVLTLFYWIFEDPIKQISLFLVFSRDRINIYNAIRLFTFWIHIFEFVSEFSSYRNNSLSGFVFIFY